MKKKLSFLPVILLLILALITLSISFNGCKKSAANIQTTATSDQTAATTEATKAQTTSAETIASASTTAAAETTAAQTSELLTPVTIGSGENYNPVINPSDFTTKIDNKYFPLTPGTILIYDGVSEKGNEHIEVAITNQTRVILGVTCVVVQDTVAVDGQMIEQTFDWYAQNKNGNVWYFGEDSKEYDNGKVIGTSGSWEAGVKEAKPGIIMEGNPVVGDTYRQEYLKGEAEDLADILSLSESVNIKYGNYNNCLKTNDHSPLEPNVVENKYFAPGIGNILITMAKGGTERMELTAITKNNL